MMVEGYLYCEVVEIVGCLVGMFNLWLVCGCDVLFGILGEFV